MKAAFVIFDRMTALDFVGVYDPMTRMKLMNYMPDFEWKLCAYTEVVSDTTGLRFFPDLVRQPLGSFDVVVVAGGLGTRTLQHDQGFITWLKTSASSPVRASACTGALLLGAAGFLRGKRATTHPDALKELEPYCDRVVEERVVDEGDIVTAGGVTSAIDLGLYLVERFAGQEAKERIAKQMNYHLGYRSACGRG